MENIVSGQDVIVQVALEIPSGKIIENGVCILVFKTQLGQPIFSCSSRILSEYLRLTQHGKLSCRIPRFPLNEGMFYLDIMLKQGSDSRDILDSIEQAVNIQVIAGDYFGTGRTVNSISSPALVQHEWSSDAS